MAGIPGCSAGSRQSNVEAALGRKAGRYTGKYRCHGAHSRRYCNATSFDCDGLIATTQLLSPTCITTFTGLNPSGTLLAVKAFEPL